MQIGECSLCGQRWNVLALRFVLWNGEVPGRICPRCELLKRPRRCQGSDGP